MGQSIKIRSCNNLNKLFLSATRAHKALYTTRVSHTHLGVCVQLGVLLLQGYVGVQTGRARNCTSNLQVTSCPALPLQQSSLD